MSSLNYKLAAFLILLGVLSGIVFRLALYLRDFKAESTLGRAHTPFGEGIDHEPYRTVDGYFSDIAWRNEPYAPISRLLGPIVRPLLSRVRPVCCATRICGAISQ